MMHTQSAGRGARALASTTAAATATALALLLGFCGASTAAADPGNTTDQIADDPPVLATAQVLDGSPVDGIPSGPMVAGGYHVHAHLTLYVDGVEYWVPAGVGVMRPVVLDPTRSDPMITAARGYYELHTHDESGLIHAEAPKPRDFTLGEFFDLWGQPLSREAVGPASGDVTVWVDGARYEGDPRDIAIKNHTVIQLDVGRDVPFVGYDFPAKY